MKEYVTKKEKFHIEPTSGDFDLLRRCSMEKNNIAKYDLMVEFLLKC